MSQESEERASITFDMAGNIVGIVNNEELEQEWENWPGIPKTLTFQRFLKAAGWEQSLQPSLPKGDLLAVFYVRKKRSSE